MRSWNDKSPWRSGNLLKWPATSPVEIDSAIDWRIRDNSSLLLAKVLCLKKDQEGKALVVLFRYKSIRNKEVSDQPLRRGPKQHHKLDNLNRISIVMTRETSILTQLVSQEISKIRLWEDHMAEHQIHGLRIDSMIMVVGQKVIGAVIRHISLKEDLIWTHLSIRLNNNCHHFNQAYMEPDNNLQTRCLHSPIIMNTTVRH